MELPRILLERRPTAAGVEVLCVKRTIERAVVDEVVEFQEDDAGRRIAVPASVDPASL